MRAATYRCSPRPATAPGESELGDTPVTNAFRALRDAIEEFVIGKPWIDSAIDVTMTIVTAPLTLWLVITSWLAYPFAVLLQLVYPATRTLPVDFGTRLLVATALVTIAVRLIVYLPFLRRATRARARNALMRPQLKRIQAKYRGKTDKAARAAMQGDLMALYRKYNTNPFAAWLPILVTVPFLGALWNLMQGLTMRAHDGTFAPRYIDRESALAEDMQAMGSITAFGMDLAAAPVTVGLCAATLPYGVCIGMSALLQILISRDSIRRDKARGVWVVVISTALIALVPTLFVLLRLGDALYLLWQRRYLKRYESEQFAKLRSDPEFILLLGDIGTAVNPRDSRGDDLSAH